MTAPARSRTAVATVPREKRELLRSELTRFAPRMAEVLPKFVTPERLITLTLVAATENPKLFECSPESIALAVMRIATWNLEIGTTAHIVPFNTNIKQADGSWLKVMKATPIADYKGLVEMAVRGGFARSIEARAVFAQDAFEMAYGVEKKLVHEPHRGSDRGDFLGAYCLSRHAHGAFDFTYMERDEIERVRDGSKGKDNPAWKSHFEEMAKKTVIRRHLKPMPKSAAFADAFASQEFDRLGAGDEIAVVDASTPAAAALLREGTDHRITGGDRPSAMGAQMEEESGDVSSGEPLRADDEQDDRWMDRE